MTWKSDDVCRCFHLLISSRSDGARAGWLVILSALFECWIVLYSVPGVPGLCSLAYVYVLAYLVYSCLFWLLISILWMDCASC